MNSGIFGVLTVYLALTVAIAAGGNSNICGFRDGETVCCNGWSKDWYGACKIAVCRGNCGVGGECIEPDTCLCATGRLAYTCDDYINDSPSQYKPVVYSYFKDEQSVNLECKDDCSKNGECIRGVCRCEKGYQGDNCADEEEGPCYPTITNGLCMHPGNTKMMLTKTQCCGIFNEAWGNPCRRCKQEFCPKGFAMKNGRCQDIDECELSNIICKSGKCRNTQGSFECQCSQGFKYAKESADCVFTPELSWDSSYRDPYHCERNPNICGTGGNCFNEPDGGYRCECHYGFELSSTKSTCVPRTAMAFNYCRYYRGMVCDNGDCIPKGRDYQCNCNPGYVASSDKKSCQRKIDVCKIHYGFLCPNGKCISVGKSYVCECNPGYTPTGDKKRCISFCELYSGNVCTYGFCEPHPTKEYTCKCYSGFESSPDGKSCVKKTVKNPLPAEIYREPTYNSVRYCSYSQYSQLCKGGFCIDREGTYECQCLPGFEPINNKMECLLKTNGRDTSYYKEQGWNLQADSNGAVSSKKPPVRPSGQCDVYGGSLCPHGTCVPSGSAYQCLCDEGYWASADGKKCSDVDECGENPSICGQGSCINTPGGYTCSCFDGFTQNFVKGKPGCIDRDECKENTNTCSNGECKNVWGSYTCICKEGYIRDVSGTTCFPTSSNNDPFKGVGGTIESATCAECSYGCDWTSVNTYKCRCPNNLGHIGNSQVCAITRNILDYNVKIGYEMRRSKRDAPNPPDVPSNPKIISGSGSSKAKVNSTTNSTGSLLPPKADVNLNIVDPLNPPASAPTSDPWTLVGHYQDQPESSSKTASKDNGLTVTVDIAADSDDTVNAFIASIVPDQKMKNKKCTAVFAGILMYKIECHFDKLT